MNVSQHRVGPQEDGRSAWRRFADALTDLLRGDTPGALVPVAAGAGGYRPAPASSVLHQAFGRRKEEPPAADQPAEDGEGGADPGSSLDSPPAVPPIPSAAGEDSSELDQPQPGWGSVADAAAASDQEPVTFEPAPAGDDLPGWTASPFAADAFGVSDVGSVTDGPEDTLESDPWGGSSAGADDDDQPMTFRPSVSDAGTSDPLDEPAGEFGWLHAGEGAVASAWPGLSDPSDASPEEPEQEAEGVETQDIAAAKVPVGLEPEAIEQEPAFTGVEIEIAMDEVETMPATVTVPSDSWSLGLPPPIEPTYLDPSLQAAPQIPQLSTEGRSFPLPSGEVVFRNLRAGFTDPARLLRHLAGEGHTGVLQVSGTDATQTYVVLVDGYVVAVAVDRQGSISNLTRISFPTFPNSQDVLNVISYPREIARGLGLLIHAPVHFRGLAAMFVNLEGLRSYLSKHAASGGLVVQSDNGIGVALFDDGSLVGAYSDGKEPTSDLAQLRELVKDLDAEIDVRFGGPAQLDPIPLDTLLAGYSL